jgi:N-methylhydantoinase A
VPKAPQAKVAGGASLEAAELGRRRVYVDAARGWRESPVYRREALPAGARVAGPAVINEMSATTVLLPGQSARVDEWGNLILEVAP